jgi:hypothetical protein
MQLPPVLLVLFRACPSVVEMLMLACQCERLPLQGAMLGGQLLVVYKGVIGWLLYSHLRQSKKQSGDHAPLSTRQLIAASLSVSRGAGPLSA